MARCSDSTETKYSTLTPSSARGDGTYLWAMLPFLMSEMMRGLPGFLLAGNDKKTSFIFLGNMYNMNTNTFWRSPHLLCSHVLMNSCSFLSFIYSLQNQFDRVIMNTGTDQYYSAVMRDAPLVVLQDGILWIIEHWFRRELQLCRIFTVPLSNTAPCCTPQCWKTHRWWWCPAPLLSS